MAGWRGDCWPRARRRCSRIIEDRAPITSTAGTSSTRSRSRSSSHRSSRAGSSRGIAAQWPDSAAIAAPAPPARVGAGVLRVTMVNHATVLLQMDSLNILTDPVWSEKVGFEGELGVQTASAARNSVRFAAAHRRRADQPRSLRSHGSAVASQTAAALSSTHHHRVLVIRDISRRRACRAPSSSTGGSRPRYRVEYGDGGARTALVRAHAQRSVRAAVGRIRDRGARDTVYFAGDTGWGRMYRGAAREVGPLHARAAAGGAIPAPMVHGAQASEPRRCGARGDRDEERNGDPDSLGNVRVGR